MSKPAKQKNFVSYIRVSTKRQGQSGLGLDAQRQTVADYAQREGGWPRRLSTAEQLVPRW